MIIIADKDNKILASYLDGTIHEQLTIQNLPVKPIELAGKEQVLLFNPTTKEVYYEYQDRPLTDAETIEQLKSDNAEIVLAMVIGGLM